MKSNIAAALTAIADPRLQDAEKVQGLGEAIRNSLGASEPAVEAKASLDKAAGSAWQAWRGVSVIAADMRLEPVELRETVAALAEQAEIKASTIAPYTSRACGLVPVYRLDAEAYDALYMAAFPDAETVTRDVNATVASALIRQYKATQGETLGQYAKRLRDLIGDTLRDIGKAETKGLKAKDADKARNDAAKLAIEAAKECLNALGVDIPDQRTAGEEAPDVLAEPAPAAKAKKAA